jgi:hypothetical protein
MHPAPWILRQSVVHAVALLGLLVQGRAAEADLLGFWTAESGNIVEIRKTADGLKGVLRTIDPMYIDWPFAPGEEVWTDFVVAGDAVRFQRRRAAEDATLRAHCPPVAVPFEGELRNGTLTGRSRDVEFKRVEREGAPVGCTPELADWAPVSFARVSGPPCCFEIDFGCDALPDAGERVRCRQLQSEAIHACLRGDYFFPRFDAAEPAASIGAVFYRGLTIQIGHLGFGILRMPDGDGWIYAGCTQRKTVNGREVWDSDSAQPLGKDEYEAIAFIATGDGDFLNSVTRVWETSEEMAREYLDRKFGELVATCRAGTLLVITRPALVRVLRGYFDVTGLPAIADDVETVRELGAAALDPDQPTGQRLLAGALIAGVVVGELLDIPSLRRANQAAPGLRRRSAELADQAATLRKEIDAAEAAGRDTAGLRRSLDTTTRLEQTLKGELEAIDEANRALGELNRPRKLHPEAPDYESGEWIPGEKFDMGRLADAYEDQAGLLRRDLDMLSGSAGRPGKIAGLQDAIAKARAANRNTAELEALLEAAIDKRDRYQRLLREAEEVIDEVRRHGIRPKLEGIVGRQGNRHMRDTVLNEQANAYTQSLVSEELGMRASRQYLDEAFGHARLPAGFGTQVHGPDWGTTVRRDGRDVHILVESKSRVDAFDPDRPGGPLGPDDVLDVRKRSGARQHSPEDTRVFANNLADKAEELEGQVQRELDALAVGDPRRAEFEANVRYYQDKQEYWRTIADNVGDRQAVELHTVIYDPRRNEYRAWRWTGTAWEPIGNLQKNGLLLD